jgi:RHS repeat-associated protein
MKLNQTTKTLADKPLIPDMGYVGIYYHASSGLSMTHFRWYNGFTRRWISRDPIGEAGGMNLYGYVGGNPLNRVDPLVVMFY